VLYSPYVLLHNTFFSPAAGKAVGAPKAQAEVRREMDVVEDNKHKPVWFYTVPEEK